MKESNVQAAMDLYQEGQQALLEAQYNLRQARINLLHTVKEEIGLEVAVGMGILSISIGALHRVLRRIPE